MKESGENPKTPTIEAALAKIGLAGSKRHVFFCVHGDCAPKEVSEASWKYLKKRLREGARVGRNEPGQLPRIAQTMMDLRGVSAAELAQRNVLNASAALPRLGTLLQSGKKAPPT